MGIALLLTGIGFLVLTLRALREQQRRPVPRRGEGRRAWRAVTA